MDNQSVSSGEWWRLFTAVTLHQDLPHLALNVATGIALLGLAMGSFGPGVGLLAAYLVGVGGNVAGFLLYGRPHAGLGASGMVMGALGLLTGQSLALLRHGRPARQLLQRGLLGGLFLFLFLGTNPAPNTDMVAHVAGFVGGIILGGALGLVAVDWAARIGINRIADVICYGLVILTWWLALR
jgi:membrane associated rhomboid family serine protease